MEARDCGHNSWVITASKEKLQGREWELSSQCSRRKRAPAGLPRLKEILHADPESPKKAKLMTD